MHHHDQPPRPPWYREWSRPAPPPGTMRVSDLERTEVTDALCRHYADGRLDEAEFNDRTSRAAAARTGADLARLLVDLPRLDAVPVGPARPPRSFPLGWLLLGLLVALSLTWTLAGAVRPFLHPHVPWFVVAVLVLVLLRRRHHRVP